MVKVRELARISMTEEKKKTAKRDLFAYYIGRPLSYILTIPFLYLGLSPNTVSVLSLLPVIAAIVISIFANNIWMMYVCWVCFFLWNLMDGVDGNIARFTNKSTKLGSVYDAMSGYAATAAIFFSWGVAAEHFPGLINPEFFKDYNLYIIIGSLSSLSTLYPRLVMQKVLAEIGKEKTTDVKSSSLLKDIVLNITSVSGLIQLFMLICIPLRLFDVFTIVYFFMNIGLMVVTIRYYLSGSKERQ